MIYSLQYHSIQIDFRIAECQRLWIIILERKTKKNADHPTGWYPMEAERMSIMAENNGMVTILKTGSRITSEITTLERNPAAIF
jgi:hypothetical protein